MYKWALAETRNNLAKANTILPYRSPGLSQVQLMISDMENTSIAGGFSHRN
jgi:hypothetical protein